MSNEKQELSAVRAKMKVMAVDTSTYGPADKGYKPQHKVRLGCVCGQKGDNKDYSDATPAGECWMNISPGRPALDFFEPGTEYYVTFTKAPKA